jgi:hypothetical protein
MRELLMDLRLAWMVSCIVRSSGIVFECICVGNDRKSERSSSNCVCHPFSRSIEI